MTKYGIRLVKAMPIIAAAFSKENITKPPKSHIKSGFLYTVLSPEAMGISGRSKFVELF